MNKYGVRCAVTAHDIGKIDAEVRAAQMETANNG